MKNLGLNKIRRLFKDFYIEKGSLEHPSFSLIPKEDKSLLLINSGMAPLKPYFAGILPPPSKRMTTCQKCIRTGDLENVGFTARHGTFFEMLGSFSFGDYFKYESLTWGWQFVTEVLEMPIDRLWASVYEEDEEAYNIWVNDIKISPERVVKLGKDDNFWEIGIGPCGPCSEIYFDRGESYGCGSPDCKPGCECDRFIEFWNHVFTQFNRDENGNYTPLAHPNIDTGMGLERVACIMQDTDSIFNVDTIRLVLDTVCDLAGVEYKDGKEKSDISLRIITDHIRAVTFMIADGIIPSNEGRGYVLRRLLRRAAVHGKKLGINKLFLFELCELVIKTSSDEYTELLEKRDYIKKVIKTEEERFASTIDTGLSLLNTHIKQLRANNETVLSGKEAFKLYDTYGMNPELTEEVLQEAGLTYDKAEYKNQLENQQKTSRMGMKTTNEDAWREDDLVFSKLPKTEFTGYIETSTSAELIYCSNIKDNIWSMVFNKTPFYAKSGGQASDNGWAYFTEINYGKVIDVKKLNDVFIHTIEVDDSANNIEIKQGINIDLCLDVKNRNRIAKNHSATHILQKALATELGSHIKQAGSEVTADGLRFDFTHFEAITAKTLKAIEDQVNEKIDEALKVQTTEMSIDKAKQKGATALFDEKYGDIVRVVEMGDYSIELCGGTHVANVSEIGGFKIISETSVGSGVRRIEAITGTKIAAELGEDEALLTDITSVLKSGRASLSSKVGELIAQNKDLSHRLDILQKQETLGNLDDLIQAGKDIGAVKYISASLDGVDVDTLRSMSDEIRAREKSVIIILAAVASTDKLNLIAAVSSDILDKGYNAGKLVKLVATEVGGGGGGKADMATAGGRDASRLTQAFKKAEDEIYRISQEN